MKQKIVVTSNEISTNLLSNLETRDVALWIHDLPLETDQLNIAANFIGLPWKLVMLEGDNKNLCNLLKGMAQVEDPLALKRGLIQLIDSDVSRIALPPRCLPIYLLDGMQGKSDFEQKLNRMTMLENFRRSGVREVIFISGRGDPFPDSFNEIWESGFRANITIGTDESSTNSKLTKWLENNKDIDIATLIQLPPLDIFNKILTEYTRIFPENRRIIRIRDNRGDIHKLDITSADEIERPILESFTLIEERDLIPLAPAELTESDFIGFFKNPEESWRPYAANLPWLKETDVNEKLRKCLRKLEVEGADANCIAYIASEAGAGGTTLSHSLAWTFAREGYPVLVAKPIQFTPEPLPVLNYLMHVHRIFKEQIPRTENIENKPDLSTGDFPGERSTQDFRFETPWILVFDNIHWINRDAELTQFRNMLSQYGRPVCILIVTSSMLGFPFQASPVYKKIAELHHTLDINGAKELGRHLNEFLRYFGKERSQAQWERFYEDHTIKDVDGIASFWVTLSFWIQGQYDLTESIQEWIYSTFKSLNDNPIVQEAILQIAAMSSERFPIPQSLLPETTNRWPVWVYLEDNHDTLSRLGLIQVDARGGRSWALIHDILGRLLINALYYDYPKRKSMGYADALNPEHFRFQILRRISRNHLLGEKIFSPIGEDFAIEIFKIDPDHGKSSFALFWREVLEALDEMPQSLKDNSRLFRHHTSISRRRISKLESLSYNLDDSVRINLLDRAISDIQYALTEIPFTFGSETDLNMLNSLAHAYSDLADVYTRLGASDAKIDELKLLSNETAQRAYRESPTNSFVIETYVKSLLRNAQDTPTLAINNCIESLGVLYSALSNDNYRTSHLGRLADQALDILLQQSPREILNQEPKSQLDLLLQAWLILAENTSRLSDGTLGNIPRETQLKALDCLSNPIGEGNLQIQHLKYDLYCNCLPYSFNKQIELLEPLYITNNWISPQTQLEYAILLYQVSRANNGERIFRSLRRLWRESEHYVQVPERLRWLRTIDNNPLIVNATIGSESDTRPFAIVREFVNQRVPIRPEEHGFTNPSPGLSFSCYVSFTINGPILRPLSSKPPTIN